MRIRNLVLLFILIGLHGIVKGQDGIANGQEGIGRGTKMILGLGSFSSSVSSEVNTWDSNATNHLNSLSLSVSYDRFSTDHLFVGVGLSGMYQSTGSAKTGIYAIAPEVGYAFGNHDSTVHPYIVGGCGVELINTGDDIDYDNTFGCGLSWSIGMGLIIPLQKNFGLVIESKYNNMNYLSSEPAMNTFSINFGFEGLLF